MIISKSLKRRILKWWKTRHRRRLARRGERLAADLLHRKGYVIWKMNWRCRKGELDIIAYRGRVLSAVEVKTRDWSSPRKFEPLDAIDEDKRRRLKKLLNTFIDAEYAETTSRRLTQSKVEAIAIYTSGRKVLRMLHIENIG